MKLSILISVYNAEKYIERCLESLLAQDINQSEYEILVRDDGSTDNTVALVRAMARDTNIVLYEDSNRGAYAQRNILMGQASGKYIYFVDADDYLVKNVLSLVLEYSIEKDLDLAAFGTEIVHWESGPRDAPALTGNPPVVSGPVFLAENPEIRHEIWWYMIKNDFLKKSTIVFEESRFHNDVMFTLKLLLEVKRMVYFPHDLYCYFQSPNSIMRSNERSHNEKLVIAGKNLIKNVTELTANLERNRDEYTQQLIDVFKYRRDKYAFYMMLRLLKSDYNNTREILDFTRFLEEINIYPLKHYNKDIRSKSKFLVLKTLINNRSLIKARGKLKQIL